MAKQIGTAITGTIGDVIFYKWKGIHVMRSKGKTGNQAPQAKEQAAIMGKASAISAKLRGALKPLFPETVNRKLMYRLNNLLQQWLRTKPAEVNTYSEVNLLKGFSFFDNSEGAVPFYAVIPVRRSSEGNLYLQLPAFDSPNPIHPLPFNGQINIKAIAVSCNLFDPKETISEETALNIEYNGTAVAAQELPLQLQTRAGYLTVVAISINNLTAGIVAGMYN